MIVLVDFENTHQSGFDGYEYLNERDTLVVYYSDENSALPRGMVDDLKRRSVNVKMVKLLKQHSNALDMYIASTTGMYLESGEKICIVSKDKGYAAVRDFWHSLRGAEILLGETIEECFLHSVQNDDERIRSAKERYQKVQITQAFETMNRVPTRPTLSRGNRRRLDFDTNRNLEPIELLPNPLSLSKPEETEPVKPEPEERQTVRKAESEKPHREIPAEKTERSEEPAAAPASAEKTASPALKSPAKRNEAAISYVYDPVTRTMKQVGGEPVEEAEETAAPEQGGSSEPLSAEEEKPAHKKRRRRRRKPAGERAAAEFGADAEEGELPAEPESDAASAAAESQPEAMSAVSISTEVRTEAETASRETAGESLPAAAEGNAAIEDSVFTAESAASSEDAVETEKKPKRRRRKTAAKKAEEKLAPSETETERAEEKTEEAPESGEGAAEAPEEVKPKRRGRKPAAKKAEEKKEEKKPDENKSDEKKTAEKKAAVKKEGDEAETKPKRRGRKPAAKKAEEKAK